MSLMNQVALTGGFSSNVSKRAKTKANLIRKVIGLGAPKEAVPLVMALRHQKKAGVPLSPLVALCMGVLGQ